MLVSNCMQPDTVGVVGVGPGEYLESLILLLSPLTLSANSVTGWSLQVSTPMDTLGREVVAPSQWGNRPNRMAVDTLQYLRQN